MMLRQGGRWPPISLWKTLPRMGSGALVEKEKEDRGEEFEEEAVVCTREILRNKQTKEIAN